MNQSLKTEKAVLKNIYFEYKNSVTQSVAFKINYTYTIIKIACDFLFLTMCFKKLTVLEQVQSSEGIQSTTVIWLWFYFGECAQVPKAYTRMQCLPQWPLHTLDSNFTSVQRMEFREVVCFVCLFVYLFTFPYSN